MGLMNGVLYPPIKEKYPIFLGFLLRLPGHEFEVFFRSAVYQAAGHM